MSNSKHTPKPWNVGEINYSNKSIEIYGPAVEVDFDDVDHDEQEANAHLIASAPDLIEALEKAREAMHVQCVTKGCQNRMSHALELAEQVIKKARGEQ